MGTVAKLQKETDTVRHIVFIFVGAGINAVLGPSFLLMGFSSLTDLAIWFGLIVAYTFIGVIYLCLVSLSFQPKRIVSPMHTQMVTAPFLLLVLTGYLLKVSWNPNWASYLTANIIVYFWALMALFLYSMIQTPIVRYLIGLNGSRDDVVVASLRVHAPLDDVMGLLRSSDLQYTINIGNEKEIRRDVFLFHTPRSQNQQLFIAVCREPRRSAGSKEMTQIVMASYELAYYGIAPPARASIVQKGDLIILKDYLKVRGFAFEDEETLRRKNVELMPALPTAYEHALACTESKILEMSHLPTAHKLIIAGTIGLLLVITLLWWIQILDLQNTVTAVILVGIATLFEFIPLIRPRRH